MLVHICCSVDSHYFLSRLKADFPNERHVGYFYNPNIFPKSEYELRAVDVKRSCERLGIEFIEGEYDDANWAKSVRGMEIAKEKGIRCEVCFDIRFEKSAQKAKELGFDSFTSTLLQSPLKDKDQLRVSLDKISSQYGLGFVFVDYLSNGGKEAQSSVSHSEGLYRQNYCGCVWGVINQKSNSSKPITECFSGIDKLAMPSSSEKRLELYGTFAKESRVQKTLKSKILNYRLLSAKVSFDGVAASSYVLVYSISSKKSWNAEPSEVQDGIAYLKKESAKIIDFDRFCKLCKGEWKSFHEMMQNPLPFAKQVALRMEISGFVYDLSPIFVVENLGSFTKVQFELDSALFEDIDESSPLELS